MLKLVTYAFAMLVVAGGAYSAELGEIDTSGAVRTAEEAVQRADEITGLNSLLSSRQALETQVTAKGVTFEDSTTAFLSDSLDGRAAWRVVYPDIQLLPDSLFGKDRPKPVLRAEVWVDSVAGKLLQVYIRNLSADSVPYRMPTAAEAELQLSDFGERYLGLPKEAPKVPLIDALNACDGRPLVAEEIIVSYVVYAIEISQGDTKRTYGPCPAWVVYTRGLRPISAQAPASMATNLRTVIDATTGDKIITNNLPYPIIDE